MIAFTSRREDDRAETLAFLTLGAAALVAVVLAVFSSIGFGNQIEPVTVRLMRDRNPAGPSFAEPEGSVVTNVAGRQVDLPAAGGMRAADPSLAAPVAAEQQDPRTAG
jgi:hypothetical protein